VHGKIEWKNCVELFSGHNSAREMTAPIEREIDERIKDAA
jgi:hypothetical protein